MAPKKVPVTSLTKLTVFLPQKAVIALKMAALQVGMSTSEFVAQLVQKHVQ